MIDADRALRQGERPLRRRRRLGELALLDQLGGALGQRHELVLLLGRGGGGCDDARHCKRGEDRSGANRENHRCVSGTGLKKSEPAAEGTGTGPLLVVAATRGKVHFLRPGARAAPQDESGFFASSERTTSRRPHGEERQRGITAVASISTRACGSTRRRTSTSAMAGKWSPITAR